MGSWARYNKKIVSLEPEMFVYLQTAEQRKVICEAVIPKGFTMKERNMRVSWHKVRNDREEI